MLSTPTAPRTGTDETGAHHDGERGSIVMSMLVIMVMGALAATMFTYSQSMSRASVRQEQQRTVIDGVDAAITHAASRIELGEPASFSGTGSIDEVDYRYEAVKNSTLNWTVSATATLASDTFGTISRASTATFTGTYAGDSPYALFTSAGMRLGSNNFSISEPIGSNGSVSVQGDATDLAIHTFAPSGSCVGCTNASQESPTWPTPEPETPTTYQNCPLATLTESNGRQSTVYGLLGTLDGKNGVPFRCTFNTGNSVFGHRPAIIYERITVRNPPVIIHVDSRVTVWFLRVEANIGGDPRDFIVEAVGGPTDAGGYEYGRFFEDGTEMVGILDAPSRDVTVDTGIDITGKMTVGSLSFSQQSLEVTADPRVVDARIEWTASDWHAVSS